MTEEEQELRAQQLEAMLLELVGQPSTETITKLQELGWRVRKTRVDEARFMGTCDYRTDRINLEIDNGNITNARIG